MTKDDVRKLLKNLSRNLTKIRKERNLTQAEVAFGAGMDYKNYQKIERKTPPDIQFSTLIKLLKFFNVSLEELIRD